MSKNLSFSVLSNIFVAIITKTNGNIFTFVLIVFLNWGFLLCFEKTSMADNLFSYIPGSSQRCLFDLIQPLVQLKNAARLYRWCNIAIRCHPITSLISLINVASRLLISENSTLHNTKIPPAHLLISLQKIKYSYRT